MVVMLLGVPHEQIILHELRFQHVDAIRQYPLAVGRSPTTVNLTLAARSPVTCAASAR